MKIHAIQTGTVAVKTRQMAGVGHGHRRTLNMFLDREWSEPLPTYAYAIEHPEGVIVVDTGETARTSETGYFPRWHPFFRFGVPMWVDPEEEIGPQLLAWDHAERRSEGRDDPHAHRSRRRTAPRSAQRDPRLADRSEAVLGKAGPTAWVSESAVADMV